MALDTSSKPVRARLFWKLGLTYGALLLVVLLAVQLYSARVIRSQAIRSANDQLASLLSLTLANPPRSDDPAELRNWTGRAARSGARVTIIDPTGRVLADSEADAEKMENHANRLEFQDALAHGTGQSVHRSVTLGHELVYRAQRYDHAGNTPIVIRLALPLSQIDLSLVELRQRLLIATLVVLLSGGLVSFAFARMFAARVQRLQRFSQRIAEGDFRPLLREGPRDELSDLADSLNQTATRLDREIRLLSGERNRSSAILRSMVEGVAVIDAEERLVFYNRAFSEILNVDPASAEGRPLIEVVRNSELVGLIRRALHGAEGLQSDITMGITQTQSFSITAAPVKALDASASGGAPQENLPEPSLSFTTSPNSAASNASVRISSPTSPTNSRRRSPPFKALPKPCSPAPSTIPKTIAASWKSFAITPFVSPASPTISSNSRASKPEKWNSNFPPSACSN